MGVDIRITLTAFTVLAPAGALAFLLMAALLIREWKREVWVERLEHWLVMPLGVCIAGLVASAAHLGTPGNALYVFNGLGRSPLSDEVTSAIGFLAVAGTYWLFTFNRRIPFAVHRVWLGASCLMALWLVAKISVVYAIPTIPTWDSSLVPAGLWALSCATAPLVTLLTLAFAQHTGTELPPRLSYTWTLLGLSALALIITLVLLAIQDAELEHLHNAFGSAAELVPWNGWAVAGLGLLGALGIAAFVWPLLRTKAVPLAAALGGTVLMLLGAALVRVAFYSMHMTL
jgi:anaerobic dimethyl sulfoxide reductase subunit C (anchor subunit)